MTRRRSPPQNAQIDSSEEVAGMPCPRSSPIHPQTHTSEDGDGTTRHIRRRRGQSPAAPESLAINEDMLWEIFLRLPPQPSSLLRASAVCKHWQGLVTDPRFLRRFRAHQGKPPLLGVFVTRAPGIQFRSILDPPDRIPRERFDLRRQTGSRWRTVLLGCRHGRVLHLEYRRHKVFVCDPVTGEHHCLDVPPVFKGSRIHGAVLCAATDQGHVHGSCHSSPFKVVLMCLILGEKFAPAACVYSSDTGVWGNAISAPDRCWIYDSNPAVLVGNILYWSSKSSLAVIKGPPCLNGSILHQIIQAEDGGVGLLIFLHGRFEVWQRKVSCHGGTTWLLQNTFEVHTLLGLPPWIEGSNREMEILGYDENNGAIFIVLIHPNVYMVQLRSMQFRKLDGSLHASKCHPFTSFYAPGGAIRGGCDGVEMLHDK